MEIEGLFNPNAVTHRIWFIRLFSWVKYDKDKPVNGIFYYGFKGSFRYIVTTKIKGLWISLKPYKTLPIIDINTF